MRSRATVVAIITVAAILIVALASALFIQVSYTSQLASDSSRLAATVQVTAHLLTEEMTGTEDVERATLAQADFEQAIGSGYPGNFDLAALQGNLNDVESLSPAYQFAAISDASGVIRAIAPSNPSLLGDSFSYRDWYRGAMQTGQAYVSEGYVSAVAGAPLVVAVATPIRSATVEGRGTTSGPIVAILLIGYRISSVQTLANQLAGVQQIDLQVTDQAHVILARTGGVAGHLIKARLAPQVSAALAGRATTVASASELAAGAPVPGAGWTVSATTPLAATTAAADRLTAWAVAAGVILMLAVAGFVLVIVTRRLETAGARFAVSEAELRTVLDTLADGVQVFGVDGAVLSRNPAAASMYELDEDVPTNKALIEKWDLLHQDGTLLMANESPLARAMESGTTVDREVLGIRRRSGGMVRWLSISVVPVRDSTGKVSNYVSCDHDITDGIETIRGLRVLNEAAERLGSSLVPGRVVSALTQAATELCSNPGEPSRRAVLLTVEGDTLSASGLSDPSGTSAPPQDRFAISDHPFARRVIEYGQPLVSMFTPDDFGPSVSESVRLAGIRNGALVPLIRNGRVFAVLAVSGRQDSVISERQLERLRTLGTMGALALSNTDAHRRAESLARTDPLTGAANRRALDDRLAQLSRTSFALAAIDVDHLKAVNDTHGHEAGDDLLRTVAIAIAAELRPSDLLARTGGDEFMVVMANCDETSAAALGRRLKAAAAAAPFGWGSPSISVGTAAGMPGDAPGDVARAADIALYTAKRHRMAHAPRPRVEVSSARQPG